MPSLFVTFQNRFNEWLAALGNTCKFPFISYDRLANRCAFSSPSQSQQTLVRHYVTGNRCFQTIPSLALLGLFIPLMGIGTLPAVTALVIYAIFPILQNTITGLNGIDPSLVEAGIALG